MLYLHWSIHSLIRVCRHGRCRKLEENRQHPFPASAMTSWRAYSKNNVCVCETVHKCRFPGEGGGLTPLNTASLVDCVVTMRIRKMHLIWICLVILSIRHDGQVWEILGWLTVQPPLLLLKDFPPSEARRCFFLPLTYTLSRVLIPGPLGPCCVGTLLHHGLGKPLILSTFHAPFRFHMHSAGVRHDKNL